MTKVLIAEDDLLIADMLQEVLIDDGYEVCGIARTVDEAIAIGEREKPGFAVLDLRLAAGGLGTEIARRLDRSAMSVLYATGNAGQIPLSSDDGEACMTKPYRSSDILRAMKIVEAMAKGDEVRGPFPRGFSVLGSRTAKPSMNNASLVVPVPAIDHLLRQQSALARFGTFALSETSLDVILNEAARICAKCLGVSFCKVCRYRSAENDFIIEAGVGWNPGVVGVVVSRADSTTTHGRTFTTQKPVVCRDVRTDASFLLPSFYMDHGIVSTLDVVIKKKNGQPWGILEIDNPEIHDYGEQEIEFATGFANVLAEAVNTAERNDAARAAVERMKDVVADRDRLVGFQAKLIAERAVLTQELQHRVRNNLQFVYSMLSRLEKAGEEVSADEIRAIARRVMTLSKVYDHLLGRDLESTIDFGGYLQSLCTGFSDVADAGQERIVLTCEIKSLMLDLDTSTALGLIIAELVSNSYRHAFPTGDGQISVSLQVGEGYKEAILVFSDNGVGYVAPDSSKRRGVGLVARLMEQIGGSAGVVSDAGTTWTLRFPIAPTAVRAA